MMSESVFTGEVLRLAKRLGLLAHHCRAAQRCEGSKGFFDLVLAGPEGVIFAELKTETGDTSADQDLWAWTLHQLHSDGMATYVRLWRPSDLENGTIERELRMLA